MTSERNCSPLDVRFWSAEPIISTIQVVELNDQPWFAAPDVCKALGRSNPTMAVKLLADSERTQISNEGQGGVGLNAISESGLYKLIMRSKKPVAKPFQYRVTGVGLQAIGKDGGNAPGEERVATGEMPEDEKGGEKFATLGGRQLDLA